MKELFRLLSFRITADELSALGMRHLLIGLVATWIVGIGRWWDDPKASLLQHSGMGSLAYILLLSLVLWLVVMPLKPNGWSYRHVLTFVSFTSPPALLYAIPIERFLPLSLAAKINLWFLLVVATWRVALLFFYLSRHARIRWWVTLISSLVPLSGIVVGLTVLNLSRGIVQIMGGLRDPSANQMADSVVTALGFLSSLTFIPLVVAYVILIIVTWKKGKGAERSPDP